LKNETKKYSEKKNKTEHGELGRFRHHNNGLLGNIRHFKLNESEFENEDNFITEEESWIIFFILISIVPIMAFFVYFCS
jgi:hypothetical protein